MKHRADCDTLDVDPAIGRSTKPCNCGARPLHPQVRIVESGTRHPTYTVVVFDGRAWREDNPMPMARDWAEIRARWLSDVLEHAKAIKAEWRVVETDNFGGDYPDESFEGDVMTKEAAEAVCSVLNRKAGPDARRYWKVVQDGYVLVPGFEP